MSLSEHATMTIEKYGKDLALEAIFLNQKGHGAKAISQQLLPSEPKGAAVAYALISAGRELMLEFLKRKND